MKTVYSAFLALTIGVATISAANARDSFSLGINIGGYGYAPPVTYYAAPPVIYYSAPAYHAAPSYYRAPSYYGTPGRGYYPPVVSYRFYDNDNRGYYGHREGRGHHEHRDNGRGNWNNGDGGHYRNHR